MKTKIMTAQPELPSPKTGLPLAAPPPPGLHPRESNLAALESY